MDLDSFLAAPKWDILNIISSNPSSPIEISEITKTTVSYVSQQLKLLEAAGIVTKTKTGAYEKGKPRNVYSLSEEFAHFSFLTHGFAEKRKVSLDDHKKTIFKIWCLEQSFFHFPLEKFFALVDDLLPEVGGVHLKHSKTKIELVVFCDKKKVFEEIAALTKKFVPIVSLELAPIKSIIDTDRKNLYSLYENFEVLDGDNKKLKGGTN